MKSKRVILVPISILLIIIGIIGLILPVMPGWIFIIIAFVLLGVKKEDIVREIKILKKEGPKKSVKRLKRKVVG